MVKSQVVVFCLLSLAAAEAKDLVPANVMVGANLEIPVRVTLSEAAPPEGILVTITSSNPKAMVLSAKADEAGSASITLMAPGSRRSTAEFYVQGLSNQGTIKYTASAPGFDSGEGTVTLAPSAVLIGGPYGISKPSFQATLGTRTFKISVTCVAVEVGGGYVPQLVAGGMSAKVDLTSSDSAIGTFESPKLVIAGGSGGALTQFQPVTVGQTILSTAVPAGFSVPPKYSAITAIVALPGIGVTENVTIGQNLQVGGAVSLGSLAGKGGVKVTLVSEDPQKLLLSQDGAVKGTGTITVTVPENAVTATYFLQGLGDSGNVKYTATAAGHRTRTGVISLSPSGLVMVGPLTLPEGQLLRPASEGGARQQGFLSSVSAGKPTRLLIHTVQLDPISHRAADITIQALRGGMELPVNLKISDAKAGTIDPLVTIAGGSDHAVTQFMPLHEGSITLSVVVPPGFTESSNDGWLQVIVSK
jgi:hypothetical protein